MLAGSHLILCVSRVERIYWYIIEMERLGINVFGDFALIIDQSFERIGWVVYIYSLIAKPNI